ncbi:MAG: M23 family metallopeptidase [Promethearchaeota archaeon]
MKKKGIISLIIVAVVIIAGLFIVPRILENPPWEEPFFDPGDRYEWDRLNYMDVIFENESDIYALNGAWSSTNSCPWARAHEGFDFSLYNNSKVLATAPGQVSIIREKDWGETTENRYMIEVTIRFNNSVYVNYNFEPWTNESSHHEHQKQLINCSVGDWIEIGQEIGRFLQVGPGAHIHFDVIEDDVRTRLDRYYSPAAYDRMMYLVHMWHPEWPHLCYDENSPLDYVNTTFNSRLDIHNVTRTYSNTTACPWGSVHLGFDFYFRNNERVYTAAPGLVKSIQIINSLEIITNYAINITIQFNDEIQCEYIFELWTSDINDVNTQLSNIYILPNIGEWIMLGWPIGDFQQFDPLGHVHFAIRENGDYPPICNYYTPAAYNIMMNLIHDYEPTWNLCYTG